MQDVYELSEKKRVLVSFSGGQTSAFMTKYILDNFKAQYEIAVVFANTSQERDETLNFVKACDDNFGFNTVWVEAKVNPEKGKGTRFSVVDYETASRNGDIYKSVVSKYGIANVSYPHCTRELKVAPIHRYLKDVLGWEAGSYDTAIGIRSDEPRRLKKRQGFVYPLADGILMTKKGVNQFWEAQDFKLGLMEHEGNCKWCFKKSLSKHIKLLRDRPEDYEFPHMLEVEYGLAGSNKHGNKRVIFRGNRSVKDMFHLLPTDTAVLEEDAVSECGTSCEPFDQ